MRAEQFTLCLLIRRGEGCESVGRICCLQSPLECFDIITVLSVKHWTEMEIEFMYESRESSCCFVLTCLNHLKRNFRLTSVITLTKFGTLSAHRLFITILGTKSRCFPKSFNNLVCVMKKNLLFDLRAEYQNIP